MKDMISNCVSKIRNEKNITQEELAHAVGVSRQTIISIEKENCTPSVGLALKIANYFEVAVEQIFECD